MKSLDAKKGEAKAEKAAAAAVKTEEKPAEKVDFSNIKIEPIFEEMVDFETSAKSDYRAVKILACELAAEKDDGHRFRRLHLMNFHKNSHLY